MTAISIFLVDDHNILRQSLASFLEQQGFRIIGQSNCGAEAITQVLELRPDVTIMDITLPDMSGVEATRAICTAWAEAHVLALTMHDEENYLLDFLDAGGCGYLHKSIADRGIITAINMAAAGEMFLRPEGVSVLAHSHSKKEEVSTSPAALSERETQVLGMVARGYTSREIGETLFLSTRTVETYRERLMKKLDLTTRAQLVDYAILNNIFYEADK